MSTQYAFGKIVTNGLVLALDAADRNSYVSGSTTWFDLSGNGNSGSLANGPVFNTGSGGGIAFDGSDDYVMYGLSRFPSGNAEVSIGCWFNWSAGGVSNFHIITAYGLDATANYIPFLWINKSTSKVTFEFGSSAGLILSNTLISTGSWYNLTVVYNKTNNIMYLNGVQDNIVAYSSANVVLTGSNGPVGAIGAGFSTAGNVGAGSTKRYGTFNGSIANLKIYNRALSAQEVLQNYNAQKARFGL